MNVIRYETSVISLAFHPSGDFVSVASGLYLYFWDWKEGMAVVHGGYPIGKCPYDTRGYKLKGQPRRYISHTRNIRAVMFHPNGEHVFVAAPDAPRIPSLVFTPCRLYAFNFDDIFNDQLPEQIELHNLQTIVPQIHLYSDGGFDISQDGQFLFTCAMLHVPPEPSSLISNRNDCVSFSPLSHRERSVADDEHANVTDSMLEYFQEGRRPQNIVDRSSRKESRPISRVDRRDLKLSIPLSAQVQQTSPQRNLFGGVSTPKASEVSNIPPPIPTILQRNNNMNYNNNDDIIQFPDVIDTTMTNDNNNNNNKDDNNFDDNDDESDELQPIFADKKSLYEVPEGWKLEEHLCLFKLNFEIDGQISKPTLTRYRPLTCALMKAVTSAKLSPTGRYAIIGYGVRNRGVVEDHPHSLVACEVIDVVDKKIKTVSIMADTEDEVNIAQFHPTPGSGILYGTKRGKVRVFQRWQN